MNPDNTLNINVVEGALPEEIDKNVGFFLYGSF